MKDIKVLPQARWCKAQAQRRGGRRFAWQVIPLFEYFLIFPLHHRACGRTILFEMLLRHSPNNIYYAYFRQCMGEISEKPASYSSRCRVQPVERVYKKNSSLQNGSSPLSVKWDAKAHVQASRPPSRSGWKRMQDSQNRGSECTDWFAALMEPKGRKKWPLRLISWPSADRESAFFSFSAWTQGDLHFEAFYVS